MDIKDVKVGDRCWVAYDTPCDEHGQNATVENVFLDRCVPLVRSSGYINVKEVSFAWVPGITVFWRKPEVPTKPKREVVRTVDAYTIGVDVNYAGGFADVRARIFGGQYPLPLSTPLVISWRELE